MEVVDLERKAASLNNYSSLIFGSKGDKLHLARRTWLVIGLQIWQELTGIGVVTVCQSLRATLIDEYHVFERMLTRSHGKSRRPDSVPICWILGL